MHPPIIPDAPRRTPFLAGVFLITFAVLVFQVVQMRILSVIAWYYLAFFAISVAMLGMTAGAVWVYLRRDRVTPGGLARPLSDSSLLAAIAMPGSVVVQFCLITTLTPTVTSVFAWTFLVGAMTVPYLFAGVTVSLALTRSPFPVNLVYGVDLLGAALGCAAVIGILNLLDGPSAVLLTGAISGLAACAFTRSGTATERPGLEARPRWRRPLPTAIFLAALIPLNLSVPFGFKPMMVKDRHESGFRSRTECWNSYSRIVAYPPRPSPPYLWGRSPLLDRTLVVDQAELNIDGAAGTHMYRYGGTTEGLDFLRYDLVNLAYHLPGISKSAVIGVGGGRDLLSAHLFGVRDVTGIEINPIFVDLHARHPFYAAYSGLTTVPGVRLHVDDARSWFAATRESFDLIQMSMIDTWAATGAGAFSLSENGLYTREGWRVFLDRLTPNGAFTVSRWYSPGDVNETGRMVALAMASMMDRGARNPRQHLFVARAQSIATLVLSKSPLTSGQLALLRGKTEGLGFQVLIAPDADPESRVLREMVAARDLSSLDRVANGTALDLTPPTDNRPFFFNQLRFRDIPRYLSRYARGELGGGVIAGNLNASIALVMILGIAMGAVVCTILLPLRAAARSAPIRLIRPGTLYFALIGMGFMFAEISLLQYFGIFLGHPTYAMGVCLFSLILSSGLGSLASGRWPLRNAGRVALWGALVGGYLLLAQWGLARLFGAASAEPLPVRILVSLAVVMPVGFLMGFAFPAGMSMVQNVDPGPTPWFWGINGATGVLASVLAVVTSMALGIHLSMAMAGLCYLVLIPTARALLALSADRNDAPPSVAGAT